MAYIWLYKGKESKQMKQEVTLTETASDCSMT